jgi:hypothetical protein
MGARANFGRRTVSEQFATMNAGGWAEVDDAVGARHEVFVVLDDEERVPLSAERL